MQTQLQDGTHIQVDPTDLPLVEAHRWYAMRQFSGGVNRPYVVTQLVDPATGRRTSRYLARLIAEPVRGQYLRYRNGDTLDLRRSNLALIEKRRLQDGYAPSPIPHVWRDQANGKWRVRMFDYAEGYTVSDPRRFEDPDEAWPTVVELHRWLHHGRPLKVDLDQILADERFDAPDAGLPGPGEMFAAFRN